MLEQMIAPNERKLWQGKPARLPYILGSMPFMAFGLAWGFFDLVIFGFFKRGLSAIPGSDMGGFGGFAGFGIPFMLLHLIPFWIAILAPLFRAFQWYTVDYAITDRRVYLSSGMIGRDYTVLTMPEITNLSVNVNLFEKMSGSGTIQLTPDVKSSYGKNSSTSYGYRLKSIKDPYAIFQMLRSLVLDVQTDMNFPNQYRPPLNPGYNTQYGGSAPIPPQDKEQ